MNYKSMVYKSLSLFFILLTCSGILYGQNNAEWEFKEILHDFGLVHEDSGTVSHRFVFYNTGDTALMLSAVEASCGCTVPSWSDTAVQPADSGYIDVEFSPVNRPGNFEKSITVNSNAGISIQILQIKGRVTPALEGRPSEFPFVQGNLRFQKKSWHLGNLKTDGKSKHNFAMYNQGNDTLRFSSNITGPPHIAIAYSTKVLAPNSVAYITLTYDAVQKNTLGFVTDNIIFFTDETESPRKEINIFAVVEEHFDPLPREEDALNPKLVLEKNSHDFGTIDAEGTHEIEIRYRNEGQSPVNIRDVQASCPCTAIDMPRRNLEPGDSATLTIRYSPAGTGKEIKQITIFSNDPKNATQTIALTAMVRE